MDEEYARKKAHMDAIVAKMARESYPDSSITDSEAMAAVLIAMKESKRNLVGYMAGREPDASWNRPSSHRPPSQGAIEYRRREEEKINKIKKSWSFWWRRRFTRGLYDTEAEADDAALKWLEDDENEIPRNPPPDGWEPFK